MAALATGCAIHLCSNTTCKAHRLHAPQPLTPWKRVVQLQTSFRAGTLCAVDVQVFIKLLTKLGPEVLQNGPDIQLSKAFSSRYVLELWGSCLRTALGTCTGPTGCCSSRPREHRSRIRAPKYEEHSGCAPAGVARLPPLEVVALHGSDLLNRCASSACFCAPQALCGLCCAPGAQARSSQAPPHAVAASCSASTRARCCSSLRATLMHKATLVERFRQRMPFWNGCNTQGWRVCLRMARS